MKKRILIILVILCSLPLVSGLRTNTDDNPGDINPNNSISIEGESLGEKVNIAISASSEVDPSVAYCGELYLVVYHKSNDIYGQLIDSSGNLVGTAIHIFTDPEFMNRLNMYPDVACLSPGSSEQYFIVVWAFDFSGTNADWDIYAQVVNLDGTLSGNYEMVASSWDSEEKPTIACEVDNYYCLVVYKFEGSGNNDLQGQRLQLTTSELSKVGDKFDPGSGSDSDVNPDLTWSMTREEYLLVWSTWYEGTSSDYFQTKFSEIYEEEQGENPISEIKDGPNWLITPGSGYDANQMYPEVAFNNLSGYYLMVFKYSNSSSDESIGVLYKNDSILGSPMLIDENVCKNASVAFNGGLTGGINAIDEFMVVAVDDGSVDYQLEGAYVWKNNLGATDLPINLSSTNFMGNPSITGNPSDGTYLIVWQQWTGNSHDIFGQRYDHGDYHDVYLPLVLR